MSIPALPGGPLLLVFALARASDLPDAECLVDPASGALSAGNAMLQVGRLASRKVALDVEVRRQALSASEGVQQPGWTLFKNNWNCAGTGSLSADVSFFLEGGAQCPQVCEGYSFAVLWTTSVKGVCKCYHVCSAGGATLSDSGNTVWVKLPEASATIPPPPYPATPAPTLEAPGAGGQGSCKCIGVVGQQGHYDYGGSKVSRDFGSSCQAWDADTTTCQSSDPPGYCGKKWCYVDPCACELPVPPKPSASWLSASFSGVPLFWSYATCGDEDLFSTTSDLKKVQQTIDSLCASPPDAEYWGSAECRCQGYGGVTGSLATDSGWEYPGDVGSVCKAWDWLSNPECAGDHPPRWCHARWCHVDPCSCDADAIGHPPQPFEFGGTIASSGAPVFVSYATCGSHERGNGAPVPAELCAHQARPGTESTTSSPIQAAPSKSAPTLPPAAPRGGQNTTAPTAGSESCKCVTVFEQRGHFDYGGVTKSKGFGSSCQAWDADTEACEGSDPPDHCDKHWCYVDPCACDLLVPPKPSALAPGATYKGLPLYWSYSTCGDEDLFSMTSDLKKVQEKIDSLCGAAPGPAVPAPLEAAPIKSTPAPTPEAATAGGLESCRCIQVVGQQGRFDYHGSMVSHDFGSSCQAWDADTAECEGSDSPNYCDKHWCYVDPCSCDLPVPPKPSVLGHSAKYEGMPLYWSYSTCGDEDLFSMTSDLKKVQKTIDSLCAPAPAGSQSVEANDEGSESCKCVGVVGQQGHFDYGGSKVVHDLGSSCQAWDADTAACEGSDPPHYCDKRWCYVDPCACDLPVPPKPSASWPSGKYKGMPLYWSYSTCGDEDLFSMTSDLKSVQKTIDSLCAAAPDAQQWGNAECRCQGYSGITGTVATDKGWEYPGDVGSECKAWDQGSNPECAGIHPPGVCYAKWCFVDPCSCDVDAIGHAPQPFELGGTIASSGAPVYVSYATCGSRERGSGTPVPEDLCDAKSTTSSIGSPQVGAPVAVTSTGAPSKTSSPVQTASPQPVAPGAAARGSGGLGGLAAACALSLLLATTLVTP